MKQTKLNTLFLAVGVCVLLIAPKNHGVSQTACAWAGTSAPAKVWNGSFDTNWQNGNNWTPAGAPGATNYVYIPSGCPRNPILYGDGPTYPAADCYEVNIYSTGGASLTWNTSTALLNVHKP